MAGEHIETVLETHGRFYQLLANPVKVTGKTYGAVIMVWDITEKNAAEQMRREFSANVSHELKTPLMSISGYAELIENGMVQPADIPEFAPGSIRKPIDLLHWYRILSSYQNWKKEPVRCRKKLWISMN